MREIKPGAGFLCTYLAPSRFQRHASAGVQRCKRTKECKMQGNNPQTTICAIDEALKYASMGLRVFPLQPGTKRPMTEHGVKDATDDSALIKKWWNENPEAGIGLAARAEKVGDPCFLEFDQKPSLKDWTKRTGNPMPVTRVHKSGGKGAPHYIFRHTEKSLALGNCDGSVGGHEWFSFRASNRYIVAPPSIHPDSGERYTTWVDIEPTPIPDWVVDEIRLNGTREQDFAGDMPPTDEEFDFDQFTEWIPADIGDEDGSWYPFKECPVAGRKHKGQGVRGCALYYDGESLGFKCHAAECPSNTDRKLGQSGISFLVSFLSQENGAYDGVIWSEKSAEEEAIAFGAEFDAISDEAPKSFSSTQVREGIVCKTKGCGRWEADATELCDLCVKNSGRKCEECSLELSPIKAVIGARWCDDCLTKAANPKPKATAAGAAAAPAPAKEPTEKKRGLYHIPEEAMYGWLKDVAKTLESPMDLAYPTMIAVFAGQGTCKVGGVQGKIYLCLIGKKGTGKSRTIDRALLKLQYDFPFQIKRKYPGSEHGLVNILEGKAPKDMTNIEAMTSKPFLLVQDEFRLTFGKMGIDNSALPYMLNELFYHDEFETSNQKGSKVCYPQLCIAGGLTCQNEEEFAEVFGKATTTGLYDRFIYGVAPDSWQWRDEWEQEMEDGLIEIVKRRPKAVSFAKEVFEMKRAWVKEKPDDRMRLGELALRVAMVTASANGDSKVSEECMAAALNFCEWQEAIRAKFRPSEQDDKDGKCQEAIVRTIRRYCDEDGWIEWGYAKRKGNLYRHTAPRVSRVYKGMVDQEMLEEEKERDEKTDKMKKTGRVRLAEGIED